MTLHPDTTAVHAEFFLWADVSPDVINRVAGLFAQHNLVPELFKARTLGSQLKLTIRVGGLAADRAEIIAAKIGMLVSVGQCRLELSPAGTAALAA